MTTAHTAKSGEESVAGKVVRCDGQWAEVDVAVSSGCGRCHEPGGCGGGLLSGGPACARSYRLANRIGAQVGDDVLLSLPSGRILRSVAWAYGLPLLTGFPLAVLVKFWSGHDGYTALAFLLGVASGFFWVKRRLGGTEAEIRMTLKRDS